ncbi:iron chaperone [Leifsonia poae]|uniref:iron chaperone n=1 Tax=Leifsonia poae TaxID=110933 RepID=UPI003D6784AC
MAGTTKSTNDGEPEGFSAEERDAIKERAKELRKASRRKSATANVDTESEVLETIAALPDNDRAIAERLHAIVKAAAPGLVPRLWYGMPAYAKGGKVLCFLQPASKYKTRYSTLGFNDLAPLDDGMIWPTAFAITEMNADVEKKLGDLMKKAAG